MIAIDNLGAILAALAAGTVAVIYFVQSRSRVVAAEEPQPLHSLSENKTVKAAATAPTTTMSAESPMEMTPAQLAEFDNADTGKPVYVAIKGIIFDVSANREMYPHAKGYGLFAGKDASRALAKSSLDVDDISSKWDDLNEDELKTLNDWVSFYEKKYPKVGRVVFA
ncbi:cytochrome b5-like heme/steroid binding domain-containing protein [Blastocladiella britannica]|nr:cytochrome b5-like heme/steroid binding domain-containing protein [Blastocladiella britannica]